MFRKHFFIFYVFLFPTFLFPQKDTVRVRGFVKADSGLILKGKDITSFTGFLNDSNKVIPGGISQEARNEYLSGGNIENHGDGDWILENPDSTLTVNQNRVNTRISDSLAQSYASDTTALKSKAGRMVLNSGSSRIGWFLKVDSAYKENGTFAYSYSAPGEQLVSMDVLNKKELLSTAAGNNLSAMLSFSGTKKYRIVINDTVTINSNLTVGSNLILSSINGGIIESNGSDDTLTVNGFIDVEYWPIFDTSLVVIFTDTLAMPAVTLEMWGGCRTETMADTSVNDVAFERAINGHGRITLNPARNYFIGKTIEGDVAGFRISGSAFHHNNQSNANIVTSENFSGDILRNWSAANPTANRYISIRNIEFHANSDGVVDMLDLRHIYENSTFENLSFVIGEGDTIQGAAFKHSTPFASSGNFFIKNINIPYSQDNLGRLQRAIDIAATAAVWIEGGNLFLDKCIDPTASIVISASGSVVLDKINFESFSKRGGAAIYFSNCGNAVIANSYTSSRVDSAAFVRVNHSASPDVVTLKNIQIGVGNPGEKEFSWLVKYDDANYNPFTFYSEGYSPTNQSGYVSVVYIYETGGSARFVVSGTGVQDQFQNVVWRGTRKTIFTAGGVSKTGGWFQTNDIIEEATVTQRCTAAGALYEYVWSGGGSYQIGDWVKAANDTVYRAIAGGGEAENPMVDADTTYWIMKGDTATFTSKSLAIQFP